MELEAQRKKMREHIQVQALFQGKRVLANFVREEDGEEVFSIQGASGKSELKLARAHLALSPAHLWEIDEKIADALSSV
jgi:hypothetical protein